MHIVFKEIMTMKAFGVFNCLTVSMKVHFRVIKIESFAIKDIFQDDVDHKIRDIGHVEKHCFL